MKLASLVSAVAIVAGAAGAWAAESKGGLALGSKAPDAAAKTKMKNVDGKMLSIADVAGKSGTLVVFTCNHCPFAKDWEQRIVELANTYAGKGIGVVLVNANDPTTHPEDGYEEMQTRAKSRGMKIPYVVDETSGVARAFGARHARGVPVRQDRQARLPRHHRRQPQGAGQGEGPLPEGRARRRRGRQGARRSRDQGSRLRHQVPQLAATTHGDEQGAARGVLRRRHRHHHHDHGAGDEGPARRRGPGGAAAARRPCSSATCSPTCSSASTG